MTRREIIGARMSLNQVRGERARAIKRWYKMSLEAREGRKEEFKDILEEFAYTEKVLKRRIRRLQESLT